ncbi:MAG: ATP-binding cassette domain-containing protein [Acidobacteria bacterium]|nr:ATP-binding cassette domain-containing protein [Acidobacteriota bacterium]
MGTTRTATAVATPALSIKDVVHSYAQRSVLGVGKAKRTDVLKGISLDIPQGTTLGLVGESGCGKTTLVKSILRLIEPTSGQILLGTESGQEDVLALPKSELTRVRRKLQVVFQDPYGSLNPRMTVFQTVSEPLRVHLKMDEAACKDRVRDLLELVGLDPKMANRYPHEFSGGQRQRVGIARALAFEPSVLILDEPVSALDVSVQAQILNLIIGLQKKLDLTYLFVSHDLAVIEHVADAVAVMYLGRIVEHGKTESIFSNPAHPYTQALLSASPIPDVTAERQRTRIVLRGDISSSSAGTGCQFHPRCPVGEGKERCAAESPALAEVRPGQLAACHFPTGSAK